MGLQKIINKRLIKRAIGSEYIYQIEAEEKSNNFLEDEKYGGLTEFIKNGVKEMKKEVKKNLTK